MENQAGIAKIQNQKTVCQVGIVMITVLKMVGKVALAILILLGTVMIMSAKIAMSYSGSKG